MAKPAKPDITAPNCPTCGQYMDKVRIRVLQQLAQGSIKPSPVPLNGWVCPNPDCQRK